MAIKVGKDRLEFCRRVLCDLHLRGFMREDGRSRPRRTTFGSPCRRPIIEDRRRSIRGLDIRQGRRFQRKGSRGSTLASRALATAIPGGTPCRHERHHCKGEKEPSVHIHIPTIQNLRIYYCGSLGTYPANEPHPFCPSQLNRKKQH